MDKWKIYKSQGLFIKSSTIITDFGAVRCFDYTRLYTALPPQSIRNFKLSMHNIHGSIINVLPMFATCIKPHNALLAGQQNADLLWDPTVIKVFEVSQVDFCTDNFTESTSCVLMDSVHSIIVGRRDIARHLSHFTILIMFIIITKIWYFRCRSSELPFLGLNKSRRLMRSRGCHVISTRQECTQPLRTNTFFHEGILCECVCLYT